MTAADKALTSVVMVAYHTGPVLLRAIEAVLAQTDPVELVVADNGNPPEVLARLRAVAEKDPRFRLLTGHGNVGFARGCNMGAMAARGEFLLFLNPDSLLPPDTFARLKEEGSRLRRPYMIGARLVNEDGSDQRGCRRALLTPGSAFIEALCLGRLFPRLRLNRHREEIPRETAPIPAISGAFMYLPREDFWSIDGFDEGYFLHVDDLDLCLRFHRAGGGIYFAPRIAVMHIGGTSEATRAFIEKNKAQGFIYYFRKNFGARYPRPFLWLLYGAIWARTGLKIVKGAAAKRLGLQQGGYR